MKVFFNASMYFSKPTGVGVYTREIWNRLYATMDQANLSCSLYAYYNTNLNAPSKVSPVRLPLIFELIFARFISLHRLIWNIFYLPLIARKHDLIYSFSSHGSPFVKNQIITIHDLICFSFPKQHKFQYLYFRYVLPFIIKASKKIVVVSEFTKMEVIRYYKVDPDKVVVILNGGDHLQHFEQSSKTDEATLKEKVCGSFFLTVGASYAHKNVATLLDAMKLLDLETKLVIVGSVNKYYSYLQGKVTSEGIKNVVFLQYVSSEFLSLLYSRCIANVYVSLYEGFGFPPLEAALHNKVSIISPETALTEVYGDAVIYVNPLNSREIADTLNRVASPGFDPGTYKQKFSGLIDKYKWTNTATGVARVIFDVLNK